MDLSVFSNLKNKALKQEGLFIAEGPYVARRLIAADWKLHSVLVSEHLANEFGELIGNRCPILSIPEREISQVVGYAFHRGVIVAAERPQFLGFDAFSLAHPDATKLVIAPLVTELENLGIIIRNSAALGADALLFGATGCDPLDRRVVRVSMGSVFSLPLVQIEQSILSATKLQARGYKIVGTVLHPSAVPLSQFTWPPKTALLLGNESESISADWLSACDHLVTIPMERDTDSLNLGVASGIFLQAMRGRHHDSSALDTTAKSIPNSSRC